MTGLTHEERPNICLLGLEQDGEILSYRIVTVGNAPGPEGSNANCFTNACRVAELRNVQGKPSGRYFVDFHVPAHFILFLYFFSKIYISSFVLFFKVIFK